VGNNPACLAVSPGARDSFRVSRSDRFIVRGGADIAARKAASMARRSRTRCAATIPLSGMRSISSCSASRVMCFFNFKRTASGDGRVNGPHLPADTDIAVATSRKFGPKHGTEPDRHTGVVRATRYLNAYADRSLLPPRPLRARWKTKRATIWPVRVPPAIAAVCSRPKPEARVAPDWQAPAAPLVPDRKQAAGVSGAVELGAGSTVRLKMFTNSARTLTPAK
jgi:hypothetical protein